MESIPDHVFREYIAMRKNKNKNSDSDDDLLEPDSESSEDKKIKQLRKDLFRYFKRVLERAIIVMEYQQCLTINSFAVLYGCFGGTDSCLKSVFEDNFVLVKGACYERVEIQELIALGKLNVEDSCFSDNYSSLNYSGRGTFKKKKDEYDQLLTIGMVQDIVEKLYTVHATTSAISKLVVILEERIMKCIDISI